MPEYQEVEVVALESFRMEIKSIVEKIKEKDATAASIQDTIQLDNGDLLIWEQFKGLLREIQKINSKELTDTIKAELTALLQQCVDLDQKVQLSIAHAKATGKESKIYFGAWLNNKNPLPKIQNAHRKFDEKGKKAAVQNLQDRIKEIAVLVLGKVEMQEV